MSTTFAIPIAAESASALQKLVNDHGGPESFFKELGDNGVNIIAAFIRDDRAASQLLYKSITDSAYRSEVIASLTSDLDRDFLNQFFAGWDRWKLLYPGLYDNFITLLMGSLVNLLVGPVPEQVNDVWDCDAIVYLDTFREDLYVKAVMKLYHPDKELGGSAGWITSSSVASYLRTISMMLTALRRRDSERELINLPQSRSSIIDGILSAIELIGKNLEDVKEQFQKMKSTQDGEISSKLSPQDGASR